jgi:anthranilate phosphoribosyltransferase
MEIYKEAITKIIRRQNLAEEEMTGLMDILMDGALTDTQVGAFMAALATKGETFGELAGAARAMRRRAVRVQVNTPVVVDTCGTGGDGAGTFNISTAAAFVVAGAGVTVAKHGNRSVSSKCGSADVLEALGVRLDVHPEIVEEAVNALGVGFLFAPVHHGALKHAAKARKEVGIRSIFNMLGPLCNPAGANCQLLGVFAPDLTEMFALALALLGAKRAVIVHGRDGLDEISICAPTRVSELDKGAVRTYDLDPARFLGRVANPSDLLGGGPADNAKILTDIFNGEKGPRRDVVVANAGMALVAAGVAESHEEGMAKARESIDSGAAKKKLDALARFTQENAP